MEGQKGLEVCLELAGFSWTPGTTDGAGIQDCCLFSTALCLCPGEAEHSRQPTEL